MSSYRLGTITFQDDEAGTLVLEGDGFAAAGELTTLLTSPGMANYLGLTESETRTAHEIVEEYRDALRLVYGDGHWQPPSLDPATRRARDRVAARAGQLLGGDRLLRLKRVSWRILDGTALVDDEIAASLQLSPGQRLAVENFARQAEHENQRLLKSTSQVRQGRLASHQPIEDAARDAGRDADDRARAVLTPEQRERFEQLKRGR